MHTHNPDIVYIHSGLFITNNIPYMKARIITLGTSHGDPTFCRFNSSTLFDIDGALYLIDAGAPANALMIRKGYHINDLKAVFVTHTHEDHIGGLPGIIKSLIKYPEVGQHTDIFMPEDEANKALIGWMHCMHRFWAEDLLSFKVAQAGEVYRDDKVQVLALATKHLENEDNAFPSYAYELNIADKKVFYTGDLKFDFSDFPEKALKEESDLCICECTHFDMNVARNVLTNCPTKRMIFNHVGDMWHGDGEAALKEIIDALPFPCAIAHDGNEFEI